MLRTWHMAAVIIIPHPEALACFFLSGPEWTQEGSWPSITHSFPGLRMALRAPQPSSLPRGNSSSPKTALLLLPSVSPMNLSRAAAHSHLAAPCPGSANMGPSAPGDKPWTAVVMVTGVPPKAKAPVGLARRLAQAPTPERTFSAAARS